jgi:hypothetical protein
LDNNLLNAKVYVLSILLEANTVLILLNKVSGRVNRSMVRQRWWPKEICPAEILVEIILWVLWNTTVGATCLFDVKLGYLDAAANCASKSVYLRFQDPAASR